MDRVVKPYKCGLDIEIVDQNTGEILDSVQSKHMVFSALLFVPYINRFLSYIYTRKNVSLRFHFKEQLEENILPF